MTHFRYQCMAARLMCMNNAHSVGLHAAHATVQPCVFPQAVQLYRKTPQNRCPWCVSHTPLRKSAQSAPPPRGLLPHHRPRHHHPRHHPYLACLAYRAYLACLACPCRPGRQHRTAAQQKRQQHQSTKCQNSVSACIRGNCTVASLRAATKCEIADLLAAQCCVTERRCLCRCCCRVATTHQHSEPKPAVTSSTLAYKCEFRRRLNTTASTPPRISCCLSPAQSCVAPVLPSSAAEPTVLGPCC